MPEQMLDNTFVQNATDGDYGLKEIVAPWVFSDFSTAAPTFTFPAGTTVPGGAIVVSVVLDVEVDIVGGDSPVCSGVGRAGGDTDEIGKAFAKGLDGGPDKSGATAPPQIPLKSADALLTMTVSDGTDIDNWTAGSGNIRVLYHGV